MGSTKFGVAIKRISANIFSSMHKSKSEKQMASLITPSSRGSMTREEEIQYGQLINEILQYGKNLRATNCGVNAKLKDEGGNVIELTQEQIAKLAHIRTPFPGIESKSFHIVHIRVKNPSAHITLKSNGELEAKGASSPGVAKKALRKVARFIQQNIDPRVHRVASYYIFNVCGVLALDEYFPALSDEFLLNTVGNVREIEVTDPEPEVLENITVDIEREIKAGVKINMYKDSRTLYYFPKTIMVLGCPNLQTFLKTFLDFFKILEILLPERQLAKARKEIAEARRRGPPPITKTFSMSAVQFQQPTFSLSSFFTSPPPPSSSFSSLSSIRQPPPAPGPAPLPSFSSQATPQPATVSLSSTLRSPSLMPQEPESIQVWYPPAGYPDPWDIEAENVNFP